MTIASGVQLWREVRVTVSDYHGMDLDVTVSWSDDLQRLAVSRIDARQPEGGTPVTSEALRQIAVQAFVRRSILASVREGLTPMGAEDLLDRRAFGLITTEEAIACRLAGPTADTLERVAVIYRVALAVGDAPTRAVRDVFEVSQSTAGAWVAAARRKGLLGEAAGPGRATA